MGYRALTNVHLGAGHPATPGDEIPETFTDHLGVLHPVDFERLVELGAAEPSDAGEYSQLKAAELKALADERGIEPEGKPTKAALVEALEASDAGEPEPEK